ncbi:hypothetical protein BDQ17DRAFT_1326797 [Cyathus striatus]|nr:hypothetical protein BDQ17DRAFT_1326797 [Cyathus striatus]
MSILTKVITTSSGLEVVSEGGNSMVPIATDLNTASDEEMGKDMGKDLDVNNEGGNECYLDVDSEGDLDADSEGGNKELPTTTASDADIGNDIVIDSEAETNLLPTAIAAKLCWKQPWANLDVHSTIPTATAPTTPISTDPIAGSIFQEGDIPKVRQTLASNYIPDALAKLKATSHKYFSEEGLYIPPRNDGNLDPIPYSYEKGYSKNKSTFVNMAPSNLKGSFTELKQFIDDGPNILTSTKREEGLLQLPATVYSDRLLTLEALATNVNNTICLSHRRSKATKQNGEENSSNFLVLGVPGEKNTVKGQNDSKRSTEDSQTAICELQWYHSWNVSGLIEGMIVTEDFSWKDIVTPRTRDMIAQNISKETLLTANDYFTGDMEIMIDQDEERRHMMMVTRNITRLNKLAARSNRKQRFVLMSIDVDSYDRMSVKERMGII